MNTEWLSTNKPEHLTLGLRGSRPEHSWQFNAPLAQ